MTIISTVFYLLLAQTIRIEACQPELKCPKCPNICPPQTTCPNRPDVGTCAPCPILCRPTTTPASTPGSTLFSAYQCASKCEIAMSKKPTSSTGGLSSAVVNSFHDACKAGNEAVVGEKIAAHPTIINLHDMRASGFTCLHHAIYHSRLTVFRFLMQQRSIDREALDIMNQTPLLHAAFRGNLEMTIALLDANVAINPISYINVAPDGTCSLNRNSKTPLDEAIYQNKPQVVIALKGRGGLCNCYKRANCSELALGMGPSACPVGMETLVSWKETLQ